MTAVSSKNKWWCGRRCYRTNLKRVSKSPLGFNTASRQNPKSLGGASSLVGLQLATAEVSQQTAFEEQRLWLDKLKSEDFSLHSDLRFRSLKWLRMKMILSKLDVRYKWNFILIILSLFRESLSTVSLIVWERQHWIIIVIK